MPMTTQELILQRLYALNNKLNYYIDHHEQIKEKKNDQACFLNRFFGDKFDFPSLFW